MAPSQNESEAYTEAQKRTVQNAATIREEAFRIRKDASDKAEEMKAAVLHNRSKRQIREFAGSPRGNLMMAKALAIAICAMDNYAPNRRAPSDQADMKSLLFGLFPAFGPMMMGEVLAQPELDRLFP